MRLIDADALKELFPDNGEGSWTYNITARMYIDKAPTVLHDNYSMGYQDGVRKVLSERPTGEWKGFIGSAYYGVDEDGEPIWRERKIYHCPFCNRRTVIKENYCPNCGAKMKGAEK